MDDTEIEALRRRCEKLKGIIDAQGPWLVTLYDASGGDRHVTREDVAQAMILLHDLRGLYSALSGDHVIAQRRNERTAVRPQRPSEGEHGLPDFDPMPNR